MTQEELDKDMIESIEMWLHEIEPKWVEKELAWLDELRSRLLEEKLEKPSEGFEEEIVKVCDDFVFPLYGLDDEFGRKLINRIARHFAQWQKEQMMKEEVEGWVAADSDTTGKRRVTFFPKKPVRDVLTEYKYWAATPPRYESINLDSNAFPNLTWEDEPKKVHIIIVKED